MPVIGVRFDGLFGLFTLACVARVNAIQLDTVILSKIHSLLFFFLLLSLSLSLQEDLRQDYNTKYWDQRYTIRVKAGAGKDVTVYNNPLVPWFLRGTADKILTTGKYLNVIRECGRGIACPCAEEIKYSPVERNYALVIEKVSDCVRVIWLTPRLLN